MFVWIDFFNILSWPSAYAYNLFQMIIEPRHEKTNILHKDTDKLHGYSEADQPLCFRYIDSTIPLLSKSKISSLYPSFVAVQPGLCGTRSKTPKTGFLTTRLI